VRNLVNRPDSPLAGLTFQIDASTSFEQILVGERCPGEPAHVETLDLDDHHWAQARISLWRTEDTQKRGARFDVNLATNHLSSLIRNYWKPLLRDDKSRLPSFQYSKCYDIANETISEAVGAGGVISIAFCDLDHFKAVNDAYGEPAGDRVIGEVASLLDRAFRPVGIALHRSGDEFSMLLPRGGPEEALALTHQAMHLIASHGFNLSNLQIRMTAGISVAADGSASYKELESRAEKAVKPGNKVKYRGKARLELKSGVVRVERGPELHLALGLCVLKTGVGLPRPFASPWLNTISERVYAALQHGQPYGALQDEVSELLNWMQPALDWHVTRASNPSGHFDDHQPIFSPLDIAAAVAHGVLRHTFLAEKAPTAETLAIDHDATANMCRLQLDPQGIALWQCGSPDDREHSRWPIGGFVTGTSGAQQSAPGRALLVKIGHFALQIPDSIFAEVIIVDDRPTRGGGLPDFWEATIARLIAHVDENPNLSVVYVLGDERHAHQTSTRLRGLVDWPSHADEIAYKTGMSATAVRAVADRLNGKVTFCTEAEELLSHYGALLREPFALVAAEAKTSYSSPQPFLRRELRLESMALQAKDGCRVATVAEAYPVVLEIARHADDGEAIRDQAGQELKELIDFRVHLTNPAERKVPAFYARDSSSLEEYFQREFVSEAGLFGRWFKKQLEPVLQHMQEAATHKPYQFSTRRAILVVPHEVQEGQDLAPLGLVSVRIIPRFLPGRMRVHYSYTWRTVEALVGFPYSLYGSVRFSEHLTEEIRRRLEDTHKRQVEMGEVSYIAHSLHIFMDTYGQSIARRIVDDASF